MSISSFGTYGYQKEPIDNLTEYSYSKPGVGPVSGTGPGLIILKLDITSTSPNFLPGITLFLWLSN